MGVLKNKYHEVDPVWHVQLAVLIAVALQFLLPDKYSAGPRFVIPFFEVLLLIALGYTTPHQKVFQSYARRVNVFLLIAAASAANIYSLARIADELLSGVSISNGKQLILSAINIFLTNIIIFGLLYWEIDGGGPGERRAIAKHEQDLLFPQQNLNVDVPWHPTFIDYLYVSSTNAMAFSPTDTMPLSRRTKLLMLSQAAISLVSIALVAARAVNILR